MLMIAITDTRRIRFFVGGFPGSRGDSLAFRARSWSSSMESSDAPMRPMALGEFILGDSGFGLTAFLVRDGDPYRVQQRFLCELSWMVGHYILGEPLRLCTCVVYVVASRGDQNLKPCSVLGRWDIHC